MKRAPLLRQATEEIPVGPGSRRDRILAAAELRFSRDGLRGVTMESVANEAGVAKATLYGYFRNRDDLFGGVAEALARRLVTALRAELVSQRPHDDRIAAALLAKHRIVYSLVHDSAHARELLVAKDRLAHAPFERADREMIDALRGSLAGEPVLAARAPELARSLFYGAHGIAEHAASAAALAAEVDAFVRVHLRGARLPQPTP